MYVSMHLVCYIRCGCHKFTSANQNKFCVLCYVATYQCNAPLPHTRAEVGEGGDLHLYENTNPNLLGQLSLYNPRHNPDISRIADYGDSGELYMNCT